MKIDALLTQLQPYTRLPPYCINQNAVQSEAL